MRARGGEAFLSGSGGKHVRKGMVGQRWICSNHWFLNDLDVIILKTIGFQLSGCENAQNHWFSMILKVQVCKCHPWALRTAYRAEGSGKGRGGVPPLEIGVGGYCRQDGILHAMRPEASADYITAAGLIS